jgi:hypothetical protein
LSLSFDIIPPNRSEKEDRENATKAGMKLAVASRSARYGRGSWVRATVGDEAMVAAASHSSWSGLSVAKIFSTF